jgi:hypothetical protein
MRRFPYLVEYRLLTGTVTRPTRVHKRPGIHIDHAGRRQALAACDSSRSRGDSPKHRFHRAGRFAGHTFAQGWLTTPN